MKKFLLLITFLTSASTILSQNFIWAKNIGGISNDNSEAIAVDASGNVYTTGKFDGTADFNPGVGTFSLTSIGTSDFFVSKLDVNGNFVWAKQIGGSGNEFAKSIKIDAAGNLYISGSFDGTVDFDPGVGTSNLTAPSGFDAFVSKWDANGNFVWVKQIGGVGNQVAAAMTIDATSNIHTTGYFGGTSDFDPGVSTFTLAAIGANDIFVSKLDANGNFVWAKNMGSGASTNLNATCISVDASGNVCTSGYFGGTLDFDPGVATYTLTSMGMNDVFVSKLDVNGAFVWAKQFGSPGNDVAAGIATDASGNVYTSGTYSSTVDFDPGVGTYSLTSLGGYDIFVSKLDASGNFVYVKSIGGSNYEEVYSITLDVTGNIYTTGYFEGTVDFDPGAGTTTLTALGTFDVFVSKLDALGDFVWAKSIGSSVGYTYGSAITCDAGGNVYTTGGYNGATDFDPNAGVFTLTPQAVDVFILKLNSVGTSINETAVDIEATVYPNPTFSTLTVRTEETIETVYIYNLLGELVMEETKNSFSVEQLPVGIYTLQIKTIKGIGTARFVKE